MHWLFFALAIVLGGIVRALYYQRTSSKFLQILSFLVPFALGILFWIKLYETGYHVTFFSTYVQGLEVSYQETAKWIMIAGTSCMITGLSWGVGAFLSAFIDLSRK